MTSKCVKKLLYFLPLLLLLPAIVFAEVNYTVSSSVVVDIAAHDYDTDINCGGLTFWGIQAIEHKTGNRFFGNPRFVSSAILSQKFTLDLPLGDYEEMTFVCSENGEDEAFQLGSIENDLAGDQVIFAARRFGATTAAAATTTAATATSTKETGIIPSLINGVLDFFGIHTGTTTAAIIQTTPPNASTTIATTEAPPTEVTTTPATTATSTLPIEETTATTTSQAEEIIVPPQQGEATSSPAATTTQISQANFFLATIGLLNLPLGTDNIFVANAIAIGILFLLAFVLSRINKISENKKTKR